MARARIRRFLAVTVLTACVATAVPLSTSQAAGLPSTLGLPALGADVFPTQRDVDAARAAASSAASGVAQAQARYDAASLELLRLQGKVAEAASVAAQAEADLQQRTAFADQSTVAATTAAADADKANRAVRREAAILWQTHQGEGTDWTAFASASGPQDIADLASALQQMSERRDATLQRSVSASRTAREAERTADLARTQQQQATEAARQARDAAETEVEAASARTKQLQQEQASLVAELARLRGVAEQVERDRQDALAAEEARRAAAAAAAEAARQAAAAAAAAAAVAAAAAAATAGSAPSVPSTGWSPGGGLSPNEARASARAMMGQWGFGGDQWGCLDSLWTGESGWQWWARNSSSGAYGIPQSLPATKMGSAGPDWLSNANTQISWGLTYIKNRYGSPCNAWGFWQSKSPPWY